MAARPTTARLWAKGGNALKLEQLNPYLRPVLATSAFALIVDLFFEWRSVSVLVPFASTEASSSGWDSASGIAAGMVALGLLISELPQLAKGVVGANRARATVVAVLGILTLGFTIGAFARSDVDFQGPTTAVQVNGHLWPAYAGLALAVAVAGLSFLQWLLADGAQVPEQTGTPHHGVI
jgi:hypothetical protein